MLINRMSLFLDPEGNAVPMGDTAALSLVIPAGRSVLLYASFDGGWEQAAVIYLDEERYEYQMGSFVLRSTTLEISPREADYKLTLIGWHKRSNANPSLPWVASRGRRFGPVVFAWDDSAEDEDYRDLRIKLLTS